MPTRRRPPGRSCATGVLVCEDHLVATLCKKGAFRSTVVATHTVPCRPGGLLNALDVLEELGALGGRVVFGMESCRTFFLVQPIAPTDADMPREDLLNLQVGGGDNGLVGHVENIKLPTGMQHLFTGIPAELAREIITAVAGWPGKRYVMHATVPQLYRAARPRRSQGRAKSEIRVVCGQGRAIAFLAFGGKPVVARHLDLRPGEEAKSIGSTVLGLRAYASSSLGMQDLEAIHLIGAPQDVGIAQDISNVAALPVKELPSIDFGPELESRLLAESAFPGRVRDPDLLRSVRPSPSMMENLPVATLLVLSGLVLGGGLSIRDRVSKAEAKRSKLLAEVKADLAHAGVADKDLRSAHEKAEYEISIAESFIVHRVYWGEFLREIPNLLPGSATLLNVDGKDLVHYEELESKSPKKKKKDKTAAPPSTATKPQQFTLIAQVELKTEESSPPEAQAITHALTESKIFKKTFPVISGANVRVQSGLGQRLARIMVTCTPPKVGT